MAASLFIEEESGTYTAAPRHPHNGYYAGDFSQTSRPGRAIATLTKASGAPIPAIRTV